MWDCQPTKTACTADSEAAPCDLVLDAEWGKQFHNYSLLWTEAALDFFLDGLHVNHIQLPSIDKDATPRNPWNEPLPTQMRLNLAVPHGTNWTSTTWPIRMEVDYVRYFVPQPPPLPPCLSSRISARKRLPRDVTCESKSSRVACSKFYVAATLSPCAWDNTSRICTAYTLSCVNDVALLHHQLLAPPGALRLEVVGSETCVSRGWRLISREDDCRRAQPFPGIFLEWGGSGNWTWMAGGCVVAKGQKKLFFNGFNSKVPERRRAAAAGEPCGAAGRECVCVVPKDSGNII